MKREYYYKEDGKMKRYIYCSMCLAGPFKQSDEQFEYLKLGGEHTPLNYCRKCAMNKGFGDKLLKRDKMFYRTVEPDVIDESEIIDEPEELIDEDIKIEGASGSQWEACLGEINPDIVINNEKDEELFLDNEKDDSMIVLPDLKKERKKIVHETTDEIRFLVVRCKDHSLYTSVSALTLEKSIKNMDVGKGPDYTKPYDRRPVKLLFYFDIESKQVGRAMQVMFSGWGLKKQEDFVEGVLSKKITVEWEEMMNVSGTNKLNIC